MFELHKTFAPRIVIGGEVTFEGEVTRAQITQAGAAAGHTDTLIIDPQKDFQVELAWELRGQDVPMRLNAVGDWTINMHFESIGPGPEGTLFAGTVERGAVGAPPAQYAHTITVPATTLPEDNINISGVYKIVITLFANSNLPAPGNDMIGYVELPLVLSENLE